METSLVKFIDFEGNEVVSARELHTLLESNRQFKNWFDYKKKQLNLIDFKDYQELTVSKSDFITNLLENISINELEKDLRGRPQIDYALTLETAEIIAFSENTERGKEVARQIINQKNRQVKELQVSFRSFVELSAKQMEVLVSQVNEIRNEVQSISNQVTGLTNHTGIQEGYLFKIIETINKLSVSSGVKQNKSYREETSQSQNYILPQTVARPVYDKNYDLFLLQSMTLADKAPKRGSFVLADAIPVFQSTLGIDTGKINEYIERMQADGIINNFVNGIVTMKGFEPVPSTDTDTKKPGLFGKIFSKRKK